MDSEQEQQPSLEVTKDGSHTLYSERFSQHYHNPNGAVAESNYVFFEQNGLAEAVRTNTDVNILEIGFGSGLNFLLLLDKYAASGATSKIQYHSIEGYPVSAATAAGLNYGKHLQHPEAAGKLPEIFRSLKPGTTTFTFRESLHLSLFYGLFEQYRPEGISFDYIFHDAFSPDVNPELWSGDLFKKLLHWSNPQAVLTTYSAASRIKGAMAWAGWRVAEAPGALGKREMTVASPSPEPLAHLKRVNEEHLAQRYEDDDF